ncbi:MAG: hypothetical protein AUJ52_14225 [Elusimicrobia bacterium CG1_02_63_36]|nr:MAG: hypothetical protein AUJ52_14225 [Elusimicrobia bacterium CG1_02_63_36]PIP84758.1 MAG: hypothetical protein COR54_02450 [Elusimicrobia bacterium CG22_combo_CG10-13_8_21_14_all_63_91]PJA17808.1 MAG: hypothetical protein COX66_03200 [Elusimicrobia bacterium CG_4_10_14_0_2_um_filter_63_34]PJB24648.1 MAG: hypothetical protein CO113_12800 [Elusimicrobia bacterium CG_4_9_14_3_um_filter_62_55]
MTREILWVVAASVLASACGGTRKAAVAGGDESLSPPELSAEAPPAAQAGPAILRPEPVKRHESLLSEGKFREAIVAFTEDALMSESPPDPETKFQFERLGTLLDRIGIGKIPSRDAPLNTPTPAADLARRAVLAFTRERDRQAVLFAAAAYGSDPKTPVFRLLLQALEAWTARPAEAGERQPPDRVAAYKLRRANELFSEKRYEDAAEQCLESLLLVPEDPTAFERLGSMYYALGAHERAAKAWRESLRLKPANDALKDFMAHLEPDGPAETTP